MAKNLTDLACRKATCEGKTLSKLSDGGGLYLWVYANGAKYWRFRYFIHVEGGKKKEMSLSLGVYPEVSLNDARVEARKYQGLVDNGIDPATAKKAKLLQTKAEAGDTFAEIAREWYRKMMPTWTETHARDIERRIEINLIPFIPQKPIAELEAVDFLKPLEKVQERGATHLSHRLLINIRQVYKYAIAKGKCKYDVTPGLGNALIPHVAKNQPAIRPEELPKLMTDIADYHKLGEMKVQLGLQLMAHVWLRTRELTFGRWDELDYEANLWRVPGERMKMDRDHLIPLTPQVKVILERLRVLARGSEYILPGRNHLTPVSNNTLLYALYRLGYKSRMTGHGFRSVASTILNESGFNADAIERQLAHVPENAVRAAYNRAEYIDERRKMMLWWSEYLDKCTAPKDQAA
ncbi:tyrosine-type recombinase/integrase [Methylovorus glucosotrophus]|uniref:Integrase family protein n=1 Tax=Methylovorus glucosotrophus (strain SIP3-4) TaxID=582744 RepID=C6XEE3_METGS|nr:integrase arm-type DNA-binding domain-containing protein [Methylovorus glucosotrophus]ACT50918.1 integrase family protein [Methylovorus glucosotrophus SIP3-4]